MAACILIADDDAVHVAWSKTWCRNAAMRRSWSTAATPRSPPSPRPMHQPIDARDARSRDARPRRHGRAGQNPRSRPQHPRDRADRPWRHRQCGFGDARRRAGFRGQAGRPRAAAGLAAQRAQYHRAEGRVAAHPAQPRRQIDLRRHRHPQRDHGRRAAHRAEGGKLHDPGPDRRRVRRRQGIVRTRHPWQRRAQDKAVRRGQLRRDPRQPRGVRSCSATRRARSPAPPNGTPASSSRPPAARFSWTKSANCR